MATLMLIVFGLTFFHLILESTILPTFRNEIKYGLFAQRDQLRRLRLKYGDELSDAVYSDIQHSINVLVNILPLLDRSTIDRVNKDLKTNPELEKKVNERVELLNSCKIEEVKDINQKITNYAFTAILVNSISFSIYLTPLILLALLIILAVGFFSDLKNLFRSRINLALHSPQEEIEKMVPVYFHNSTNRKVIIS